MKHERAVTVLQGSVLACLISIGSVWAMITAFDLTVRNANALVLVCVLSAVVYSATFGFKWGGIPAACLTALVLGYLWHRGEAEQQLYQLLYRITYVYNKAYSWGVFKLVDTPWNAGAADLPMAVLGWLLSLTVARTVCRGKSCVLAVMLALIPLGSCLVVTDTVPAQWCLFVLLLGLVILILTSRVRRHNPIQGNRLTFMAAITAALALAALFLAVPQEGYVNQSK